MSFCKSRISILGTLPHSLALVAQAQGCLTQIHHCFCNNNYKTNLSSPPPLSILTGWLPWRSPLPRPLHIASLFFVFTARRKYPCTLAHTVETRYAVRLILLVDFMTRSLQLWSGLIAPRLSTRSTEGYELSEPKLADVNTDAFGRFYCWLYSGIVDCTNGDDPLTPDDLWNNAVVAYVFADYYQVQHFKNAILDYLFLAVEVNKVLSMKTSIHLYPNTVEQDMFRKLLVDLTSETCNLNTLSRSSSVHLHKDYMLDLIIAWRNKKLVPGASINLTAVIKNIRSHFCERYHDHFEPEDGHTTKA
jgi:hypothetical protein